MRAKTRRLITLSILVLLLSAALAIAFIPQLSGESPSAFSPEKNLKYFEEPSRTPEMIELLRGATFTVWCTNGEVPSVGTGWLIDIRGKDHYVVTAAHVVEECADQGLIELYNFSDTRFAAELLSIRLQNVEDDPSAKPARFDIALLKTDAHGRPLKVAASRAPIGSWNALAGWTSMETGYSLYNFTRGHVTGESFYGDVIVDSAAAGGMSGGPAINNQGEVIGVLFRGAGPRAPAFSVLQPLENLCQVVYECDELKKPIYPLTLPTNPIFIVEPQPEEDQQ